MSPRQCVVRDMSSGSSSDDHLLSLPSGSSSGASKSANLQGTQKGSSRSRRKDRGKGHARGKKHRCATIDMLPDDVWIVIFDLCIINEVDYQPWAWVELVHVCRRWRQLIFASPHRLHLQLGCTRTGKMRKTFREHLGFWPAFPIFINFNIFRGRPNIHDDVMAALEHPDRIYGLHFDVTASQLAKLATITRVPFPVLTKLRMFSEPGSSVLPSGFLGGSAPHLQDFHLSYIASPELPTLLSSACGVVTLQLQGLSQTGRISPETMVACLAGLPKLETLSLGFLDGDPHLDQIRLSPITRTVVPSLTFFKFVGYSNYVEDLVALIDCPRLNCVKMCYSYSHLVNFQLSQLYQFINRSEDPRLLSRWAGVYAEQLGSLSLSLCHEHDCDQTVLISLVDSIEWRVSHLIQLLSQFSAKLSDVHHLSILWSPREDMDPNEWLRLFRPFTAVRTLHAYGFQLQNVANAFEAIAEREMAAELFPALLLRCFEPLLDQMPYERRVEPDDIFVPNFDAARRLSGRPITVVGPWNFHYTASTYY